MENDKVEIQQLTTPQKAMLQALEKSLGVVTSACKMLGTDRTSHYRWLKESEAYRVAFEEIDNVTLDFAESALHKQINDGSTAATIFLLKTRGKKRGYIEKTESKITTINNEGEEVGIDYSKLPTEVLEAIVKATES